MTRPPTGRAGRGGASDLLANLFGHLLDAEYTVTAAPRTRRGRWTARTASTVVLVAAGFLLAVAYHSVVATQPAASKARAKLVSDVQQRQQQADALQRQADQLRGEVARQREAALAGSDDGARLFDLGVASGLAAVHGDGVAVRLTDAPAPVDPVTGKPTGAANLGRVLDRDLQDVANELWRDGAEAIAINGERLTATSTIRQAGGAILVDFRPVTGPYEVTAIGPADLDRRFDDSDTGKRFKHYVVAYGMQVSVKRLKGASLSAGPDPRLRYAAPIPTGSPVTGPSAGQSGSSSVPSPSGGG